MKKSKFSKEDIEGESELTSDYNTNFGLPEEKFKQIQSIMKFNSENSGYDSPQKLREERMKHVIDDELEDSIPVPTSNFSEDKVYEYKDPLETKEKYRIQFEMKSHIENLKKKIKQQEAMKRNHNQEAK
jgi:hypothetical protein